MTALHCTTYIRYFQLLVTGLKPSFSVDFAVNEGYFVSNMVVVKVDFISVKMAIVKQPQVVKTLILVFVGRNDSIYF